MKAKEQLGGLVRLWRLTQDGRTSLLPREDVKDALLYCLGVAASLTGAQVHTIGSSLTGYQVLISIPPELVPTLMREANRSSANVYREQLGIRSNFWCQGPYGMEVIETPRRAIQAMAEILLTAVRDGVVARPEHWLGLGTLKVDFGETLSAARPEEYFAKEDSTMPDGASLTITIPPMLNYLTAEQVKEAVRHEMERRIVEIRDEMRKNNQKPLGLTRAMKANPHRPQPVRRLQGRSDEHEVQPWVGQEVWGHRVAPEYLVRWSKFLVRYKAALDQWRVGNREVEFPPGTYWMCVFHNACREGG